MASWVGRGRLALWSILLIGMLVGGTIAVIADHLQTENGRTISFNHKESGANEWWVEVTLAGSDAGSVAKVEGMDTNGPWVTLAKQGWGDYGASFHIEAGHLVRFRATWPD